MSHRFGVVPFGDDADDEAKFTDINCGSAAPFSIVEYATSVERQTQLER